MRLRHVVEATMELPTGERTSVRRNEEGFFVCPVQGCTWSSADDATLRNHIKRKHGLGNYIIRNADVNNISNNNSNNSSNNSNSNNNSNSSNDFFSKNDISNYKNSNNGATANINIREIIASDLNEADIYIYIFFKKNITYKDE
jgi:hypothetical protein